MNTTESIYRDKLVSIDMEKITFYNYYYPSGAAKTVFWNDIKSISVEEPTIWNGKWRLHGTGSLRIWFPRDMKRPLRDRIFFAELKSQKIKIGFTVEDSEKVEAIFSGKSLID